MVFISVKDFDKGKEKQNIHLKYLFTQSSAKETNLKVENNSSHFFRS